MQNFCALIISRRRICKNRIFKPKPKLTANGIFKAEQNFPDGQNSLFLCEKNIIIDHKNSGGKDTLSAKKSGEDALSAEKSGFEAYNAVN